MLLTLGVHPAYEPRVHESVGPPFALYSGDVKLITTQNGVAEIKELNIR